MEERREQERFDLSQVGVWLKDVAHKDDPKIPFRSGGTLTNFSSNGLGILSKEAIKKGTEVIVRIKYGNKQSHATGRVVRRSSAADRNYKLGIELGESDKEFLVKLIVSYFRGAEKQSPYGLIAISSIVGATVGFVICWLLR